MKLTTTGSQTVGPYFHIGLSRMLIPIVAGPEVKGTRVTIKGRVLDADQKPIPDALLETWQANANGKYAHPDDTQDKPLQKGFLGFGRVATDDEGSFSLTTIKPGRVPGSGGRLQAPHIEVAVSMRGLLKHLVTRIYFPEEPSNGGDAVLQSVDEDRRATLIANSVSGHADILEWDVHCAGENETAFFEI
jgi:protocatechuate 3,4-dioxygenase alpha subunit